MSLSDQGIAHFYFSFKTTADGNYVEIPLVAAEGDAVAAKRVAETAAWLAAEKQRLGAEIERTFSVKQNASPSIAPLGYAEWRDRIKCVADIAVLALTLTSPTTYFVAQFAVDGASAVLDGVAGDGEKVGEYRTGAAVNGAIAGTVAGVGKVLPKVVSKEKIATLKRAGIGTLVVGTVGVIGFQAFDAIKKHGLKEGLKTSLEELGKLLVPLSCQAAYDELVKEEG